jgi:hypothetical protein
VSDKDAGKLELTQPTAANDGNTRALCPNQKLKTSRNERPNIDGYSFEITADS